MEKLGIIIVIESGDLEQKTKMLVDSIRTFGGEIKDAKIWAVKPRKGKAIRKETLNFFKDKEVEFFDIDLNKKWYLYGFANKIYASAYIEEKFGDLYDTLLFLDCDTIVIDSIDQNILNGAYIFAVKPAEEKFIEISKEDKITPFWEMIYDICDINPVKVWTVTTTVDQKSILACFNSGVIFSKSNIGFYNQWLKNFEKLTLDLRSYHIIYTEFYLLEQALLAGTIIKTLPLHQLKLLNNSYNFPFHFYDNLREKEKNYDIKILHYHHLFDTEPIRNLENFSDSTLLFLNNHLPLKQYQIGVLQKACSTAQYIFWRIKNKWKLKLFSTVSKS